jgi:hypothetical protein
MLLRFALSAVLYAFAITPGSSQTAVAPSVLKTEVYPLLYIYESCATRHLKGISAHFPGARFEEHEASIRPACGAHIEAARTRMLALGYSPDEVTAEIRIYYNVLRPKLIASLAESEPYRPAPRAVSIDDEAAQRVHNEAMARLYADYRSCVNTALRRVVLDSNESAATIVEAVMANCMDYERKLIEAIEVFQRVPREQAQRSVDGELENVKRRLLGQVVIIRADLNKVAKDENRSANPETTGSLRQAKDF